MADRPKQSAATTTAAVPTTEASAAAAVPTAVPLNLAPPLQRHCLCLSTWLLLLHHLLPPQSRHASSSLVPHPALLAYPHHSSFSALRPSSPTPRLGRGSESPRSNGQAERANQDLGAALRPAFIWYRNGSPLSLTNQGLQFTARSEDTGKYSCAVKGYEDLRTPAVALNEVRGAAVYAIVGITATVAVVFVAVFVWEEEEILYSTVQKPLPQCGDNVQYASIQFVPSNTAPCPAFTWYWNGSPLSLTNQRFHFTARSEDAGKYSCAVKGYEDLRTPAVALNVRYPPKRISVSVSPTGEILEGSSVNLTCSSDANPPVQRSTWFKNNRSVFSETGGPEESYTIKYITQQDAGEYYCEAGNEIGTNSSPPKLLDVQYSPKNTSVSVSPSAEIEEGSSVTLTCSSDANPPVQSYTWFKKNETGVWQAGSAQSLNFSNFRSWNSGQYY
ncbi:hypothetical protein SKAU_G00417910 [Synaphobranchus kaupii]|uniref:Ig-like domain-containing protein n=1 Tax=Synaphobranchus kaupii TaxID=118154 RepID=A0A9Q1IA33_SYNKA|nr:hypothetical protein SKAU_G00417910 [Synaphobranchus kaupii]